MTTTHNDTIPAPSVRTLAGLRAVALESTQSLTSMLYAADCQAWMLRTMLPIPATQLPAYLSDLIPSILVEYIDEIPMSGISFWADDRWRIHIRASDPVDVRQFTILHELKHIIDHPLRQQQPDLFSNSGWEKLADHFAARMLVGESNYTTRDHGSTTRQQIAPQSTTKTGGAP